MNVLRDSQTRRSRRFVLARVEGDWEKLDNIGVTRRVRTYFAIMQRNVQADLCTCKNKCLQYLDNHKRK